MKYIYLAVAMLIFPVCFSVEIIGQPGTLPDARLLRFPTVSDKSIVFTYANDLWEVARSGGKARRLTSHPGAEIYAHYSPDGKWIAFTAQLEGDFDVYIMPADGGEAPKRLTYYPGFEQVLGWTPDSRKVLFHSRRASFTHPVNKLFMIGIEGGFPEALPLPDAGMTSFSPDGKKLAYNRISTEYRYWKRYRGGRQSYVSLYDLNSNKYEEITHTDAADVFPMWYQNTIYFISDRDGVMNLYRYNLQSRLLTQITHYHDFDIKYPSLGSGTNPSIVYENGGFLYTFDIKSEEVSKVTVRIADDLPYTVPRIVNAENYINSFGISPDGESAVFGARGEIFTAGVRNKEARDLTNTSGARELSPVWSPDGTRLAYFSDRSGEYQLYIRDADGKAAEKRVTSRKNGYLFNPVWSPDSKKVLFSDNRLQLFYVDVESGREVLVDASQNGSITGYSFSPDSRLVAYAKRNDNLLRQLKLYSVERNASYPLTSGKFDDRNPVFEQSGKYLFFLSDRNFRQYFYSDAEWGFNYNDTTEIYVVVLANNEKSPFAVDAKRTIAADPSISTKIDIDGITGRTVAVPVPPGNYTNLRAGMDRLFYLARPPAGTASSSVPPPALRSFNFMRREIETVLTGNIGSFYLSADGLKIIYSGDNFGIIESGKSNQKIGDGELDLSGMKMNLEPRAEWKQIFDEAWRIERDFYYKPDLRGRNWAAVKKRYEPLLPFVAHRDDLNYLIGEMIGELSTSHLFIGDGDMPNIPAKNIGLPGAEFETANGFYRFKKIYRGDNSLNETRAPLAEPGMTVREGEYLIAVNDRRLRAHDEPYSFFENTAGKETVLTVNTEPAIEGARKITIRPTGNEMPLRYLDWVESNRQKVLAATNGRCGYIHVPDTGSRGTNEFVRSFYAQTDKEAVIIDARWNAGGQFPTFFIELLRRSLVARYAPREGNDLKVPGAAIFGPKVMLVNEYTSSGGDAFAYFFKRAKIGQIIGQRTMGATVGNTGTPSLIDDGFVEAPALGLWDNIGQNSQWMVENRGVLPDITIDNRPDLVINGQDPQLEKAIEVIKEQLIAKKPAAERPR